MTGVLTKKEGTRTQKEGLMRTEAEVGVTHLQGPPRVAGSPWKLEDPRRVLSQNMGKDSGPC